MAFADAARVSLWDAVRRIVLRTEPDGPRIVGFLKNGSMSVRHQLGYVDKDAARAERSARANLESWCAQELIDIRGAIDGVGPLVDVRVEWFGRQPDYERNCLSRDGMRIERVALCGGDIDRLCAEQRTAETRLAPVATANSGKTGRGFIPQILKADAALWPDGNPPPRQDRIRDIREKLGYSHDRPDDKTFDRAFKEWTVGSR